MPFTSGTTEVGEEPVPLCTAGNAGVRVKNVGHTVVFVGGAGVGEDGYPLNPGVPEVFYGGTPKETAIVPAPPGDLDQQVLYARTGPGAGTARVSWIGA